jgi:hypothetical protein
MRYPECLGGTLGEAKVTTSPILSTQIVKCHWSKSILWIPSLSHLPPHLVTPRSPSYKAAPSLPPSLPHAPSLSIRRRGATGRPRRRRGRIGLPNGTVWRDHHPQQPAQAAERRGGISLPTGGTTCHPWKVWVAWTPVVEAAWRGATRTQGETRPWHHEWQLGPGHKERRGGGANFFIVQKTFAKCYVGHSGKLRRMPMSGSNLYPRRHA